MSQSPAIEIDWKLNTIIKEMRDKIKILNKKEIMKRKRLRKLIGAK